MKVELQDENVPTDNVSNPPPQEVATPPIASSQITPSNNQRNGSAEEPEGADSTVSKREYAVTPNVEEFGRYVVNRLSNIRDERKRRRLEVSIQKNIIDIETEDIEDDN